MNEQAESTDSLEALRETEAVTARHAMNVIDEYARGDTSRYALLEALDAHVSAIRVRIEARVRAEGAERTASWVAYVTEEVLRPLAGVKCNCDEAYTARGRHEPNAFHADFEDVFDAARAALNEAAPLSPEESRDDHA